jgi:hypothetical protein
METAIATSKVICHLSHVPSSLISSFHLFDMMEPFLLLFTNGSDICGKVIQMRNRLCGVVISVLATRSKGRGFKPGRCDGFLILMKIAQHTFLRMGNKAGGHMSLDFTARKRTLHSMIEMLRQGH